jgi:hypothetical protein
MYQSNRPKVHPHQAYINILISLNTRLDIVLVLIKHTHFMRTPRCAIRGRYHSPPHSRPAHHLFPTPLTPFYFTIHTVSHLNAHHIPIISTPPPPRLRCAPFKNQQHLLRHLMFPLILKSLSTAIQTISAILLTNVLSRVATAEHTDHLFFYAVLVRRFVVAADAVTFPTLHKY